MDAMRILAAGALFVGTALGQAAPKPPKGESRSTSTRSASAQHSSDQNGVKSTTSAKRTVKDGVVVEESGDAQLLDSLMKSGVHLDDLEKLVRELAKVDAPALPSGGAKPVVRRSVKVVKNGKVIEESGTPPPPLPGAPRGASAPGRPRRVGELGDLRELGDVSSGLAELRALGLDLSGLEQLIEQTVADALAGRMPDPKEVERRAQKIRVNGAPVEVRAEVLSGAEALAELKKRCPELVGDLDRLVREVGGALDCEFAQRKAQPAPPVKPVKPVRRTDT